MRPTPFNYDAKADAERTIETHIDSGLDDYTSLMGAAAIAHLTGEYQTFRHAFIARHSDETGRLTFSLGQSDINVQLDNIGFYPGYACGELSNSPAAL